MREIPGWLALHGGDCIQALGVIGGLLFAGLNFRADIASRRLDSLIRLTENHRAIWTYFEDHPELSRILSMSADLTATPITKKEKRFVQRVLHHLNLAFHSTRSRSRRR